MKTPTRRSTYSNIPKTKNCRNVIWMPPVKKVVNRYQSGNTQSVFEAKMLGGRSILQHGLFSEYYQEGQLQKSGNYEYGKKTGEWTFWDSNGVIRKRGSYQRDKQHGEWKKFREDGTLEWMEVYQEGLAEGMWEALRERW